MIIVLSMPRPTESECLLEQAAGSRRKYFINQRGEFKMLDEKNGLTDDTDDMDNTVTLTDEFGNDIEFEFLDLIEYDGEEYVVLLPREDDCTEVVILQIEENADDDEHENYLSVEDNDTLMAVFNIFKEKFKEDYNFSD